MLVLVGVTFAILLAYIPVQGQSGGGWLDPAWQYRSVVTITNPGSTILTNFQVHVTLDSTFDFAKAKSDGSDVRFTSEDGVTLIPFWIETWDSASRRASIWVRVPMIPAGSLSLYMYYGNSAASSTSDGTATFEFFDDFDSGTGNPLLGYYNLGGSQTILENSQPWEGDGPHTLSVVQANSGGYAYWGYYGLVSNCGGVGLARSSDLVNWTKYSDNPLFLNGRWPSVLKLGNTFYMLYTKDYCTTSYIKLAISSDGIHFSDVKTIVQPQSGTRNQNPNLFYNPNDGKFYIYWYHGDDASYWEIRSRNAFTIDQLDNLNSETSVLTSNNVLAAPNMLFYDNTYFLSVETQNSYDGSWETWIYSSSSPTNGFSLLPGNPILSNGSACNFQHVFGTNLHNYYCKQTDGIWIWTVEHRMADLTEGRLEFQEQVDPSKWGATSGSWSVITDIQQDGSVGGVVEGVIGSSVRQVLLSSYQGSDYVLEAYGNLLSGRVLGLGVRATDQNNLYSINLYEDLDGTNNLYVYRWVSGSASTLARTPVGVVNADTWYKLSVKVHANSIDVYKDDVLMLQTSSSQYSSGKVGLYGERNTVAEFNNVLVRKFAAVEPTAILESDTTPTLISVTVNPSIIVGGSTSQGTVTLSGPAPSGGAAVSLYSSNTQVASVPANVTVLSGNTSATFTVGTSPVSSQTSVIISAIYGGATRTATLTVNKSDNPLPTTTGLSPNSATAGGPAFTLTVNGTNFISGSVVRWNGSNRTTTYVSATQLTASIGVADIAVAGTASVTVFNPSPGGGTSNAQNFTINNPVPTTTSLSPSSATTGGPAFTLTVNGSGFVSNSVVRWNGSDRSTTFVSSTQLTASIPASDIATAGTASVTVFNPSPGGGTSNPQTFTVNNPLPATAGLTPSSATAGGPAFTLTVNGSGFVASSVVRWNGSTRTATYVSSTQLTAAIPASDIALAGTAQVTVFNPTPGGGTSNAQTFTIDNPVPTTAGLSPTSATAGGAAFTLTVNGTNVVSGSVVRLNGLNRTTTYVSATQLTAAILAADIATAGTASVTVFNATPGGGTSNAQTFTISSPAAPTITSLSPSSTTAGSPGFTLTVNGTNFVSGSAVQWGGSTRTTTFVSATQLTASIVAADIAAAGTVNVTVLNPGGVTSGAMPFTINNPMPATTGLSPSSAIAGGPAFTLTVNGSGFVSSSVVRWNGANRTTTYVSSTQLIAAISASDIAVAGTATVTVFNPAPGGGLSNAQNFTINNPAPTTTSLSPSSATAGAPAFTLTVGGTNFVSGSVVRWNGSDRTTTYVSATQLTASILAADIATAGTASVTVFNPLPGGGTSNVQAFTINVADNPIPTTTGLSPNSATPGGPAFTLTVNGTNFISSSVVKWDGSDRTTTYVSATQLTAAIPASEIAVAGSAQVTVFNPAPGGGTSNAQNFTINNPMPTTTSLSPSSATAGGSAFNLTVNGTNFVSSSVVRWNGSDRTTTFISSTQLTASISAADIAVAGTAQVTVFNPAPGGGLSNAQIFTINVPDNPVPTTTSLSPSSATAGGSAFTLAVNGTNFISGSVVRWNGSDRSTTYVSPTQLTASISAADIAVAGTAQVTVFNPAPGGGVSNAQTFTINVPDNPVPTTTGLSPSSATAAGSAFTLAVNGTNFISGSVVRWNGSDRTTTLVSSTQLTAAIPASDIAVAGTTQVTVFNPAPGGGTSNAQVFTINNPVPTTTGLSPSSATAGGPAFTLTVNGTNFIPSSIIRWNGSDRSTTYVSATQLTASISAADIAVAGTVQVTVFNPAPGGGTSNAQTFTINNPDNPIPTTTNLSPSSATAGAPAFTLTVSGTNFVSGSVVRWNGSDRTTTYVSATQLTASILAADIATAGTATVTVFNPAPGGGLSNAQNFTITVPDNPVPTTTGLSPTSATAGGTAFTLTVNGTNFISGSVVKWNGSDRTTTYVSLTQLRAVIPASDIAVAGTAQVTVFNPSPGGGVSNAQTFTINNPTPAIASLSPSSATAGGAAFTLTVNGSRFVSNSVVRWNGLDRTTTFVSSTRLTAAIPASDIAVAGRAQVRVFNPGPGGGISNVRNFRIY